MRRLAALALVLALAAVFPALPVRAASTFSLGTDSFPVVSDFISGARLSLDAELFHLTDKRLVTLLKAAAKRGVAVRLILDPGQSRNRQSAKELEKDPRVQVRWMLTDSNRGQLMHAKSACADAARLLVGSANWTHSGMNLNREAVAVLEDGGLALEFGKAFERDWSAARPPWPSRRLRDEELQSLPDPSSYVEEEPHFNAKKHE